MSGANLKGRIQIPDGKKTWFATLDFNALCDFEELTGRNDVLSFIEQLESGAVQPKLGEIRKLMFCALKQNHDDVTEQDAGRLCFQNPDALTRAMSAAAPDAGDVDVEGSSGN